jgi:hypothetical protein
MADQATMKINGPATSGSAAGRRGAMPPGASGRDADSSDSAGPGDVVTNVAEFGENLLTLAELQAKMAAIELKQNVQAVKFGGAVLVTGAVVGVAALPVALLGIAGLLATALNIPLGAAQLIVATVCFIIAGICAGVAIARLRGSDLGFPLSGEEFTRNINWVRTVLLHSGRSARSRRRF